MVSFIVRIAYSFSSLVVAGTGLCLLLLTVADVVPMREMATAFSSDGELSAFYAGQLKTAQFLLGCSLVLAAVCFGGISAFSLANAVARFPFRRAALFAGMLAVATGWYAQEVVFDGIPHVTDAISHLFQSKIFLNGSLHAATPECPDIFYQFHILMTHSGKWFTKYTPGQALFLALASKCGLLSVALPLCAAAITVLLGLVVEKFDSPIAARGVMLLFALSPLSILLSGSFMSHVPALLFALLGFSCYCFSRCTDSPSRWRRFFLLVAAGFFLGCSAITRPHEFLMIGVVAFLYFLTLPLREWRYLFRSLAALILGISPILALWITWNQNIYGDPLAIGYGFTSGDVIHRPFQGTFGLTESFTFTKALAVLAWNLDRVNHSFFGWPASLLFVPLAFIQRGNRLVLISVIAITVFLGTYFLYDYRAEFESRYYYIALPFFTYLTIRGIRNLIKLFPTIRAKERVAHYVLLICSAFYFYALSYYWPVYLVPKYRNHYEDASRMIEQRLQEQADKPALCLIEGADANPFVYSAGFIFNDPDLRRDIIYGRYLEAQLPCVYKSYASRNIYLYRGGADGNGSLVLLKAAESNTGLARQNDVLTANRER